MTNMIYFVEAVGPGHIKIGSTKHPMEKRLATLQTGNSYPLRVLGTESGWEEDEQGLRHHFWGGHIRGEWFEPAPELLERIRTGTKQFRNIEAMDRLFGKKLVRDWIGRVPRDGELFNWGALLDRIEGRLRAGETPEAVVAACHLEIHAGYVYYGWTEGRRRRGLKVRYRGWEYHFLFERNSRLYRYTTQIPDRFLPSDLRQSIRGSRWDNLWRACLPITKREFDDIG
jgi:hypothetical protein